jgi:intracellular multiplication protein IcmO
MSGNEPRVALLDDFRVRGEVFMDGLLKVLRWAQAEKGVRLDAAQIQTCLPFVEVGRLVQARQLATRRGPDVVTIDVSAIPEAVLIPLRAYLHELPGFDPRRPADRQGTHEPQHQHEQVVLSLRKDLESYLA